MRPFAEIHAIAAARKGGEAALERLLPPVKSARALKKIPDDRWLAGMTKRVFQAGFNWSVIENKWDGFEAAFDGFQPNRCAMLSDDAIDALCKDTSIVRNPQKILTVRDNAVFLTDLAAEHGSAAAFFADWPDDDYIDLLDLLKKRGSRLGGATAQFFLRGMGKDSFMTRGDVVKALIREGVIAKDPTSKKDLRAVQDAFNRWRAESGRTMAAISRVLACSVDSEMPDGAYAYVGLDGKGVR